jgi:hypothetical protein
MSDARRRPITYQLATRLDSSRSLGAQPTGPSEGVAKRHQNLDERRRL